MTTFHTSSQVSMKVTNKSKLLVKGAFLILNKTPLLQFHSFIYSTQTWSLSCTDSYLHMLQVFKAKSGILIIFLFEQIRGKSFT